jgi:DhnA family fructose-bisphosphate aldolase class Ia
MKNPKSGHILTVAIDHAPSYGVLAGLENIQQVVAAGGPRLETDADVLQMAYDVSSQ